MGSRQHRDTHAPNTGHLLDYVLTRQHDTRDVLHTRVMPSAEGAFALKSPPKRKGPQTKKLQVHKLRDPRVKNNFKVMLEERLHCVTAAEPEEQWKQMKTILQETTAEVDGLSTRKHQDWFDKADKKSKNCSKRNAPATIICLQNLMIRRPRLHTRLPAVHSRLSLGPCKKNLWTGLAERTQRYVDKGDMRAFYDALKAVYGPSTLFGWKYPADRQGSHSPVLVRAFRGPFQ